MLIFKPSTYTSPLSLSAFAFPSLLLSVVVVGSCRAVFPFFLDIFSFIGCTSSDIRHRLICTTRTAVSQHCVRFGITVVYVARQENSDSRCIIMHSRPCLVPIFDVPIDCGKHIYVNTYLFCVQLSILFVLRYLMFASPIYIYRKSPSVLSNMFSGYFCSILPQQASTARILS